LQPAERLFEIFRELRERPFDAAGAADQDMVGAGEAGLGEDRPGELAQAAPHPIADDGVADLLRDGEAEPHRRVAVVAGADEQDEAGRRRAPAGIRREEVRAAPQLADRVRI